MNSSDNILDGADLTANLGSETMGAFEELKLKIKEARLSDARDYSLLEDQVMPEFCESPQDTPVKIPKAIDADVSTVDTPVKIPKAIDADMSMVKSPSWQEKISDESFLLTERLVAENMDESLTSVIEELKNSGVSSFHDDSDDSDDDSKNFNDTLEEMEYIMNKAKKNAAKNEPAIKQPLGVPPNTPSSKPAHPVNRLMREIQYSSPLKTSNSSPTVKQRFFFNSPVKNTPITPKSDPFRLPLSTGKFNSETKSPMAQFKSNKFQDVISPIRCYIKNSPVVPLVANVSPTKNYWDRNMKPIDVNQRIKPIINPGKENAILPETAYKSSKITNVVEKPSTFRLPMNHNKVVSVAKNLPKPLVIKHVKREKLENEFRNRSSSSKHLMEKIIGNNPNMDDNSFAHLPVNNLDVSHCIGKAPLRTRTLN